MNRCQWAKSEICIPYHDREWGVPQHDDRILFEHLLLDTMQAGLSWELMLRKRENFRKAFDGFDPAVIAQYDREKVEVLLTDPGIIRNRLKVNATVGNASGFLRIQEEFGTFNSFLWRFVDGTPVRNGWKTMDQLPVKTPVAEALSGELKGRGFKFVGPTICYAFMQAVGMVNDHTIDCFRHDEVGEVA